MEPPGCISSPRSSSRCQKPDHKQRAEVISKPCPPSGPPLLCPRTPALTQSAFLSSSIATAWDSSQGKTQPCADCPGFWIHWPDHNTRRVGIRKDKCPGDAGYEKR